MSEVSNDTVVCDVCGTSYGIGCSPFCRDNHEPWSGGYDTGFEPYDDDQVDRNGPVSFGNRGERSRYLAKHHIEYKDLSHRKRKLYFT